MKHTFARRTRRRATSSKEGNPFKKENQTEQTFFGEAAHNTFFQPAAAVQRKCEKCEEEEKDKKVQAKVAGSGAVPAASAHLSEAVNSGGTSLPSSLQHFFSQRLQYDFSSVKIHNNPTAHQSAKNIHAQAYTYGNHVVFASEKYQPQTNDGKKLLAHELTHVMQQQGVQRKVQMKNDSEEPSLNNATAKPSEVAGQEEEATKNEELATQPISLPDITTLGTPSTDTVFAQLVRFTGKTDADFDGGTGQTKNLKALPAKDCSGCDASDCLTVSGILEVTYHVNTTVNLPSVPDGLTPCQAERVKSAIDNKIAPHEQQHVSAFNTYNGKVNLPINYTGCRDGLEGYLQNLHDTDGFARKAAAKAKSNALDPFFVDVDLDCKEPEPPKK